MSRELDDLLREQWEHTLRTQPEFASILGDKRYNDKSADLSQEALARDAEHSRRMLARLRAIEPQTDADALNKTLMARVLEVSIEDFEWNEWEMPVSQINGIHLYAAQLPSYLSFASAKEYDDYATRLRNFPKQMDDTIAAMRKGVGDRLMPPRFLIEKIAAQAEAIGNEAPEASPFAQPLMMFPDALTEADRTRIRAEVLAAVRDFVLPAYRKFAQFVRDDYAPHGQTEVGIWALPDGDARYERYVRLRTTTALTPDQIHSIGLREVARIEREMVSVAKKLGYASVKELNAAADANPSLRAQSREQILDLYRRYIDQMYAKLPALFGRLPRAKVVVVPTEEFREKEAPSAEYASPALDGSRPGRVQVNTGEPEKRKIVALESTAYHEAVPGHHMQIAIAQELPDLPDFRRNLIDYTAYIEGWALYAEHLGKEVGFYEDPWSEYGHLQDEMLRAIRLVVDTGLHAKRWSREQVVRFFHDHSAIDEIEVQNETDRYIVWPGQALGYKIGQLAILDLRERARKELGDRFDIRAFHDEILGAGPLPLDLLDRRIASWSQRPAS